LLRRVDREDVDRVGALALERLSRTCVAPQAEDEDRLVPGERRDGLRRVRLADLEERRVARGGARRARGAAVGERSERRSGDPEHESREHEPEYGAAMTHVQGVAPAEAVAPGEGVAPAFGDDFAWSLRRTL